MASSEAQVIHGARGLAALAALVVGLALLIATEPSNTASVDRTLWPNFVESEVVALGWTRPAASDVALERHAGGWRFVAPPRGSIDQGTVEAVLATLRSARWHRREPGRRAGAISATLTVRTASQQVRAITVGDSVQGADQTWITIDKRAYLVDDWVVRALNVDLLALVDREPLRAVAAGDTPIRIVRDHKTLDLLPRPWRSARGVLSPEVTDRLIAALSQLHLAGIPARASGGAESVERTMIALPDRGVELAIGGECGSPHRIVLQSRDGDGCVEATRWNAVLSALAALDEPPGAVLDRRPAAADVAMIKLPDGTINLEGRPTVQIGDVTHHADPARVSELRTALASIADVVPVPSGRSRATIEVTLRSGVRITLSQYGATFVRDAETIGLRLNAADLIGRSIESYIDPTRWVEDPNTLSELEFPAPGGGERTGTPSGARVGTRFVRGLVIGEWLRDGQRAPAAAASLIDAVAHAISEVRAPMATLPSRWSPVGVVRATFSPPVGAKTTHHFEFGPVRPDGCLARIDGIAGLAPPALCTAAMAVTAGR